MRKSSPRFTVTPNRRQPTTSSLVYPKIHRLTPSTLDTPRKLGPSNTRFTYFHVIEKLLLFSSHECTRARIPIGWCGFVQPQPHSALGWCLFRPYRLVFRRTTPPISVTEHSWTFHFAFLLRFPVLSVQSQTHRAKVRGKND